MKAKPWWQKRCFGQRLALLTGAALMLTLGMELACNLRALTTASLTPVPVAIQALACDPAELVTLNAGGASIMDAAGRSADLICEDPGLQLHTVAVTLSGKGTVSVSLLIRDQASAFTPQQVYSVYCVADDSALRECYATVESSGLVSELCVRLKMFTDDPFTVESVTLNAPVPFVWQPARMALTFSAAFALLCALCLRGFRAVYDPSRRTHRMIVALPLAALMALSLLIAQWIEPDTPLFTGITDVEAAQSNTDIYAVLYETLCDGRLSVETDASLSLAALHNPYDQSERIAKKVSFPFDYAYYHGKIYIYYGVAPALAVYAPYRALTGRVPDSRDATLIMGWLTIAMIGWAVCGLTRRYAPGANVFALSLCCVTAVFASGVMFLIASADFYYLAELSYVGFCAGSIGFGLHASIQKRPWLAVAQYALSGLCFALTATSRPGALPMLIAFLTPLYLCEIARKRACLREAGAFLIPALLGVGFVLWYNAARFGSPFEFGARYQLTVTDMRWRSVNLRELPEALCQYLLTPLSFNTRFPYLSAGYHPSITAGRYLFTLSSVGVLAFPVTWVIALMPLASRRFREAEPSPLLQRERRWTYLLPLLVSLPLMLVSYGLAGIILRYTCDFRLFYTLAGVACALPLMSETSIPERRALAIVCAALCLVSILIGIGLIFDNERNYIASQSPQIFYGLQRMLFPCE